MSKKLFSGVLCLAAALAMGLSGGWAAENAQTAPKQDLPRPDGKEADMSKPVQVCILLGQSNMVGMGKIAGDKDGTLEYAVKTKKKYSYLVDDAGNWTERKDVRFVRVMGSGTGPMRQFNNEWMTVKGGTIGPELGIGHYLGNSIDAPVMILKSCIGNRSLGWDLLPPGSERYTVDGRTYAGYKDTPDSWIEGQPKKEVNWYAGKQYDDDMANAKAALENLATIYPDYKGQGYEIAGFVWWQGHKDQNPVHAGRYEENLVRLIQCLRRDYNAPNAKFVLATIAFDGWKLAGPGKTIAEAQLAVGDAKEYPQFAGNVKAVEARDLWREAEVSPKNQGYHYNRNAETFMEVGLRLGWAMANLPNAEP